jgi:predicted pyridoxine 5'-phosphate oxidase superfamily flavin-nucleotide-binding protein
VRGCRAQAERLARLLDPPDLAGGASKFLAAGTFAVLTARDDNGWLWASPLIGRPGFVHAGATVLRIGARPQLGDPLHHLPAGQSIGMIAIDFATRRRMRVNGTLSGVHADGLTVDVDQAYGNCPQYIAQRDLVIDPPTAMPARDVRRGTLLSDDDTTLIEKSDTFFLGTTHPERGSDASHRGGTAGVVRVVGPNSLWWPDYPGNNMFNSFGNLAVDDTAALLFTDFTTGSTVQLSGGAAVKWGTPGAPGDDGGVGRRVRFTVRHTVSGHTLPVHTQGGVVAYQHNPSLT